MGATLLLSLIDLKLLLGPDVLIAKPKCLRPIFHKYGVIQLQENRKKVKQIKKKKGSRTFNPRGGSDLHH